MYTHVTHFGFTNIGSKMHISRATAKKHFKFWFGSPCKELEWASPWSCLWLKWVGWILFDTGWPAYSMSNHHTGVYYVMSIYRDRYLKRLSIATSTSSPRFKLSGFDSLYSIFFKIDLFEYLVSRLYFCETLVYNLV